MNVETTKPAPTELQLIVKCGVKSLRASDYVYVYKIYNGDIFRLKHAIKSFYVAHLKRFILNRFGWTSNPIPLGANINSVVYVCVSKIYELYRDRLQILRSAHNIQVQGRQNCND